MKNDREGSILPSQNLFGKIKENLRLVSILVKM
jgi:hypothetical protein